MLKQANIETVREEGAGEQAKRAFRGEAAAEMFGAEWGNDSTGKQGQDAGCK
jgi:hypothetical protein